MQVELSIIKYLLQKDTYNKYNSYINVKDFPEEIQYIYNILCSYHNLHDESISVSDLGNLIFANNPKDKEYYEQCLEHLEKYVPVENTVVSLIESLKQRRVLQELSIAAYEIGEGKKDIELLHKIYSQLNDKHETIDTENLFVSDDLEIIFKHTLESPGLRWRLDCLNKSLGSLRKGNFGFIFSRPETGKTTFLASEVSHMIAQTDKPILWFNNEQAGEEVMLRVYQAYFGCTVEQLYGNIKHYRGLFKDQTGGRFKLYDSAQINKNTVESLSKELSPGLILFDQIDKLQGFKAERDDLLLGSIYQWGRELAKQYCPVIGITQADGSAEGVRKLTMAHVANAKTAKQAEADFILGIGKTHDAGWESFRWLNISKNKLLGDSDTDSKLRHGYLECLIDTECARYRDLV